jgi:translation elongation factor EF-G
VRRIPSPAHEWQRATRILCIGYTLSLPPRSNSSRRGSRIPFTLSSLSGSQHALCPLPSRLSDIDRWLVERSQGFKEAVNCGQLIGHPVEGCRVTLTDGAAHAVSASSSSLGAHPRLHRV